MNENSKNRSIISFDSYINIDYPANITNEPIKPGGPRAIVEIHFIYGITPDNRLLSKLILQLYKDRTATVDVEINNPPEWSSIAIYHEPVVEISQELISGNPQALSFILTVEVNEEAPAFGKGDINFSVSVPDIIGRFGLTRINGVKKYEKIPFSASYKPKVNYEFPNGQEIMITPFQKTKIPINFINLGNAKTKVTFEIIDFPNGWEVDIGDDIFIMEGEGERGTVDLTVKTDDRFEKKWVIIEYTPKMAERPEFSGTSEPIVIFFTNDGSYKVIDISIETFALIIIIIILIFIIVFLIRKNR